MVLPGDDSSDTKQPAEASQPASDESQSTDAPLPSIGPNLAEALADEEKSVNDQIKEFEKKPATPPPPPAPDPSQSSDSKLGSPSDEAAVPDNQATAPEINSDQSQPSPATPISDDSAKSDDSAAANDADSDAPRTNNEDDKPRIQSDDDSEMPKKKVLHPSEDFLKGGSKIDDLLEKELANEAAKNPDSGTVIKDPESTGQKDPDQVIDDIEKSNQEINKIAL